MCICSGFGKKKLLKFPSGSDHTVVPCDSQVQSAWKGSGKKVERGGQGEPAVMSAMTRNSMVGSYDILTGVWQLGVLRLGRTIFECAKKRLFSACFTVQTLTVASD